MAGSDGRSDIGRPQHWPAAMAAAMAGSDGRNDGRQ
jgi:hypothetical protein